MPRDPIDRLRVEMEELFNDLWQVPRFTRRQGGFRPQIDCYRTERPAAFHVIVELAGVDPAKVQVFADEGTLIVVRRAPPAALHRAASTSRWRSTTAASRARSCSEPTSTSSRRRRRTSAAC